MIAGEQRAADWDAIKWVRTALWIISALLVANTAVFAVNGRPWFAVEDTLLAAGAAVAAFLIAKRDERGWWLALIVLGGGVIVSAIRAVVGWDVSELGGSWIALFLIWTLRRPPRFRGWRLSANSA